MIDRKTIDQVYQAADIVDVVSDFVSLKRSGANYKGLCPFHEEKTPSFVVSPARGTCHCFGCHKGGNVVNFLMEINNMTYPEAIRWLAKKYNIEVIETGRDEKAEQEHRHREELYALNTWANDWFQHTLHDTDEGQGIGLNYFRSRGFRDDIIHKFQLGYCPASGYALADAARKNHLSEDNLVETGLCIRTQSGKLRDRFFGRTIFPVHNYMGKVVAFGGRILEKKDNVGKYLNSPESIIYNKSRELYGIYFAKQQIQKQDCCYLVEGYTDVISMHQCGIENVVASSGTALTHDQIRLISKFTTNLTVLYDGDSAGIHASLRGIDMLLEHGLNIKVLLLPDGDDPDSFARKHNAEEYRAYINSHQVDFIRFKTDLLLKDAGTDVRARANVINNIADSIARIDDTITRSLYIKECAGLTGVREQDVLETVNSKRNALQIQRLKESQRTASRQSAGTNTANTPASTDNTPVNAANTSAPGANTPAITANTSANTANTSANTANIPASATEKAELNLMRYLIRYGEQNVGDFYDSENQLKALSFAEFISDSMEEDEILFSNPVYSEVMTEILNHLSTPGFRAATYLLSHPSEDVRNLALRLTNEGEGQLGISDSAITTNLYATARILMDDMRLAVVSDKISDIDKQIKSGTLSDTQLLEKMQEYSTYKQVEVELRKNRASYN